MSKKRKILLGLIITIMVMLVAFLIYYLASTTINFIDANKNSKKIVLEFNELYESDKKEIILFASPTCQFCKRFVPILNEIKKEKSIDYYYLDVSKILEDDLNKITSKIEVNIKGIPHLIVLKDKKVIGELSGFKEKEQVLEFLKETEVIEGDV